MTTARWISATGLTVALMVVSACGGGGGAQQPPPNPASFEIRLDSSAIVAMQDSDGLLRVQIARQPGSIGALHIALVDPPEGVSGSAVEVEAGDEALLPLRIAGNVPAGHLTLTISGSGSGLTSTTSVQVDVQPSQPRAKALIQAALNAGQIDLGTALLYRTYAVFGDVRLPAAFIGSGPAEEDRALFGEIERNRTGLPHTVLEQLRPFLLRPDDPQSVFSAGRTTLAGRERPSQSRRERPTADNDECSGTAREWITLRSALHPVRAWALCEGTDATNYIARLNLLKVIDVVDKAYGAMTQLMGPAVPDEYGDDAIDVYIVPLNADAPRARGSYAVEGVRGVEIAQPPFVNGTSSGYLMLPTWRLAEQDYQLTLIHELFHVLQDAHNSRLVEYWFSEASATWASVYFNRTAPVHPAANRRLHTERFGGYQQATHGLFSFDGSDPYSSYIWVHFMEQERGKELVGQAWQMFEGLATNDNANSVLDFLFPFEQKLRVFALRNLNQLYLPGDALPRADRYISIDEAFPDLRPVPAFKKRKAQTMVVGTDVQSLQLDQPLEPLSAGYFEATVNDPAIKKVVFKLDGMALSGFDIDALVKIDGTWETEPRNLNGKSELKFCLDKPDQKLDQVVFIVTNHQKQAGSQVTPSLGVKATAEPCALVWSGTVTSRTRRSDAISTHDATTTAQVTFEFDDSQSQPPGEVVYRLRSGSNSYVYDSLVDVHGRNPPCRSIQQAAGAMLPGLPPFQLTPGYTSASLSVYRGSPQQYVASGLTVGDTTNTDNCNDRNADTTTRGPFLVPWWAMGGPLDVSADGKTLAGTYVQNADGLGGTITFVWNLTLQSE